jgi:hypothetical protein
MTVESIKGVVEAALRRASTATGVDFGFLMKTANRESGSNPNARAGTSSAAGLFQFVDQTWMSALKQHGAKHGYGNYAALIEKGSDGRYHIPNNASRQAVMGLKLDPHAASLMAGELTSDHASYLRGRVGRDPTAGELYAAHFLGPQGSAKLIEAVASKPSASAASLFPDAAAANRSIFYRSGRPATVEEVYANLTKVGPGQSNDPVSPAPESGYLHYTSARNADLKAQQEALIGLILNGTQEPNSPFGASRTGSDGNGSSLGHSIFTSEMLRMLSEARDAGKKT